MVGDEVKITGNRFFFVRKSASIYPIKFQFLFLPLVKTDINKGYGGKINEFYN